MAVLARAAAAVCCLLTAMSGGVLCQSPVVNTPYGTVRGLRAALGSHMYVDKFLGIPYAKAPVGDLRFRAPEAANRWNGTLDGTHMGSMCPQPPDNYVLPSQVFPQSEDCLLLNVYRPKVADGSSTLPVMVWIHGGGFVTGSGGRFDWTQLAAQGVVVVAINYRLDALGFLSTEDAVSPGNYGLLDQILALRWVRDVIPAFHGDPADVTIFGESAGGSSVSLLVLSREAKGLFHKAIAESGGSFNTFSMSYPGTAPEPRQHALQLGRRLGCQVSEDSTRLLDCLRTKDVGQLLAVSAALEAEARTAVFKPIPETTFGQEGVFAGTPEAILRNNGFSNVPTMRGFNHDEGAISVQDPNDGGFTMEQFRKMADATCRPYLQQSSLTLDVDAIMTQVMDAYVIAPNVTDPKGLRQAFIQLVTDFIFSTPIILELEKATQHALPPQYLYRFDYRSAHRLNPAWKGTMHTDEIPYVSGAPVYDIHAFPNDVSSWTDDDVRLSRDVMTMWSNFAKYGNPTPSPVNGTRWLPWTQSDHEMLAIGSALHMVSDPLTPQQKLWLNVLSRMYFGASGSMIG